MGRTFDHWPGEGEALPKPNEADYCTPVTGLGDAHGHEESEQGGEERMGESEIHGVSFLDLVARTRRRGQSASVNEGEENGDHNERHERGRDDADDDGNTDHTWNLPMLTGDRYHFVLLEHAASARLVDADSGELIVLTP